MTSRDFCYWLQGYFEIHQGEVPVLTLDQVRCISSHLAMVFKHEIDPSQGTPGHQTELQKLHDALKKGEQPSKIGGVTPDGLVYRC